MVKVVTAHHPDQQTAAPTQRPEIADYARHVPGALPGLLALVPGVERVQRDATVVLGPAGVALVAGAWQRRVILGPTTAPAPLAAPHGALLQAA